MQNEQNNNKMLQGVLDRLSAFKVKPKKNKVITVDKRGTFHRGVKKKTKPWTIGVPRSVVHACLHRTLTGIGQPPYVLGVWVRFPKVVT